MHNMHAAEGSSSAGFLLEDRFAFPDSAPGPVELVFGCEADETGEIFRQQADGIMGMGNNNNAFQSQVGAHLWCPLRFSGQEEVPCIRLLNWVG